MLENIHYQPHPLCIFTILSNEKMLQFSLVYLVPFKRWHKKFYTYFQKNSVTSLNKSKYNTLVRMAYY